MRVTVICLLVLVVLGCRSETAPQPGATTIAPAPDPKVQQIQSSRASRQRESKVAGEHSPFSTWPTATEKPVRIAWEFAFLCRSVLTYEETRSSEAYLERHGPHANCSIIVRVNPESMPAFRKGKSLPDGSVVVKEKYADEAATGPLRDYATMTKREAGYDPEGGNWEYAYVNLVPERKEKRGRLAECSGCHATARDRDYLFRSYTPSMP